MYSKVSQIFDIFLTQGDFCSSTRRDASRIINKRGPSASISNTKTTTIIIMKKILLFAAVTVGLLTLTPSNAEAGSYRSRVVGTCHHCHKSIYSYYRPVRYSSGSVRYSWITSQHLNCSSRYRSYSRPTYNYRSYNSRPSYNSGYGGSSCNSGGQSLHSQVRSTILHHLFRH